MRRSARAELQLSRDHAMASSSQAQSGTDVLTDVLDDLVDASNGGEISVDDVLDAFDDRGFGVLCTVLGLIAAFPVIGAIPGVSVVVGLMVLLIAGQAIFGLQHPWVPTVLRERSIPDEKLEKGADKARPYTEWIDQYIKPRLEWLTHGALRRRLIAVAMCVMAVLMIPLALVPWGVQPPATAIVMFGIALVGRDGVFAALGYALAAISVFFFFYMWQTIQSTVAALFG